MYVDVQEIRGVGLQVSRLENADTAKQGLCCIILKISSLLATSCCSLLMKILFYKIMVITLFSKFFFWYISSLLAKLIPCSLTFCGLSLITSGPLIFFWKLRPIREFRWFAGSERKSLKSWLTSASASPEEQCNIKSPTKKSAEVGNAKFYTVDIPCFYVYVIVFNIEYLRGKLLRIDASISNGSLTHIVSPDFHGTVELKTAIMSHLYWSDSFKYALTAMNYKLIW